MNRSFRHRMSALAGVLLAGTVLLAWASPASAATTGSEATFGGVVASCPTNGTSQNLGPVTIGGVTADQIQCLTAADGSSNSAQVQGTDSSGDDFMLQCLRQGDTYILNQQTEGGPIVQTVSGQPISASIVVDGVTVTVFCGPAAAAQPPPDNTYGLAVDVGAASGGGPDLASEAATSTESSGSGATWLFVAGAAALLVIVGQLVIGRRIGRSNPATD